MQDTILNIENLTFEDVKPLFESSYELHSIDYNRNWKLSKEVLQECIETRSTMPAEIEIGECFDDDFYGIQWAEDELKKEIGNHFDIEDDDDMIDEIFERFEDDIRDEIYNRDESTHYRDILNQNAANVVIELFSNYDCINSHWFEAQSGYSYQESYFGACVDALNLNPAKVKKMFIEDGVKVVGRWPNKKDRDGKEMVDYGQFYGEIENRGCGANLLTILGKIDLSEMKEGFTKITIPKGNPIGFYSSCYGGGSMLEATLKHPLTIDLSKKGMTEYDHWGLSVDGERGYSVKEVFGCGNEIFDGDIETNL